MNKIFKVIWSKSKQCYIVVSEMAKNGSMSIFGGQQLICSVSFT